MYLSAFLSYHESEEKGTALKTEDSRIRKEVEPLKPSLKLISMDEVQTEEMA